MATNPSKTGTPKPAAAKTAGAAKSAKTDKPAGAAKPSGAKASPADKARASKSAAVPKPVTGPASAAAAAGMIRLRDLVDSVAAATGAKKPDAKASVEAVLAAIGAGLAAKSVLVVPPLGKLRVAKSNGSVLTLKLRLADASRAAGLALADDGEDG